MGLTAEIILGELLLDFSDVGGMGADDIGMEINNWERD